MAYLGSALLREIYLWHFPHRRPVARPVYATWWITLGVTLAFSIVMAALCLRFVDSPIKRWRKRAGPIKAFITPR